MFRNDWSLGVRRRSSKEHSSLNLVHLAVLGEALEFSQKGGRALFAIEQGQSAIWLIKKNRFYMTPKHIFNT
jgi:hypothetical protein